MYPLPPWMTDEEGVQAVNLNDFRNNFKLCANSGFDTIYQRAFLYKVNLSWFHVFIKYESFNLFLAYVDRIRAEKGNDSIYYLPYSCLCNGGSDKDKITYHRHLICVMEQKNENYFMNIQWKTFQGKKKLPILPVKKMHLINCISYVCNTRSQSTKECNFFERQQGFCYNGHIYVFKTIIPFIALWAMLLTRDGVKLYLNQKISTSITPYNKIRKDVDTERWYVRCKDILKEKDLLFPLEDDKELTLEEDVTCPYIYVGKKKLFITDIKNHCENQEKWTEYQLRNNNRFLNNMGNDGFFFKKIFSTSL